MQENKGICVTSLMNALLFDLGFEVIKEQDIVLTLDDIRMFTSAFTLTEDETDDIVTHLLETTVKALLVRCSENVKVRHFLSLCRGS